MKKLSSLVLLVCATISSALEGGPTQPDYIQFEPAEMKDMVSPMSGNFSYSIPLGEVPSAYGNYPLSLSYHAGISPQTEATWVGLGWTLSPGSIVRDLRGVPDDQFHGGTLGYIYQYSASYSWSIDVSYSNGPYSVGVNMSSTGGFGVSATLGTKIEGVGQVGFSVSTDQGIGFSGSVGFGGGEYGLNASAMFNPKSKNWTFGAGASLGDGVEASLGVQYTTGQSVSASVGLSAKSNNMKNHANILRASVRRGGTSASLGPVSVSVANSSTKGSSTASSSGLAIVIPTNVGVFSLGFNQTLQEYHMRSATSDYVYGYLYQGGPAVLVGGDKNANNIDHIPGAQAGKAESNGRIPWKWTFKGRTLETLGDDKLQPAYDMFTVESEGVSGTFRAYPREEHQMFKLLSNYATDDETNVDSYNPILKLDENKHWPQTEEFVYKGSSTDREPTKYTDYKVNNTVNSPYADYQTYFMNEGNRLVYNLDADSDEPLTSGMNFLFLGEGGYYESEIIGDAKNRQAGDVPDLLLKRSFSGENGRQYALYGSRKVEPIFEDVSPVSKLKGFRIINSDGTKYIFSQPVKSYLKIDYSINQEKGVPAFVERKLSKNKDFWKNFGKAALELVTTLLWPPKLFEALNNMFSGSLEEKCKVNPADVMELYSYQINMNPYATQWLLTEIQGADYIQLDKVNNDISKNIGYNVRFHYTKPSLYQWRSPYAQPNAMTTELPNFRMPRNGLTPVGCDTKMYQASFGVKEYVYLTDIETPTHKVKFQLNDPLTEERVDGKGWYFQKYSITEKNKQQKMLPILTTATLSLKVKSVSNEIAYVNYKNALYEYDALFVNVEIPELLQKNLKKNPKLALQTDYAHKLIHVGNGNSVVFLNNDLSFEVDTEAAVLVEKTKGEEAKFGLYKIKLKKGTGSFLWRGDATYANNMKIVLAENGQSYTVGANGNQNVYDLKQCQSKLVGYAASYSMLPICWDGHPLISPIIDWSDIVFAGDQDDPSMNQMRYLKKISYYKKKKEYKKIEDNGDELDNDKDDYEHLDLYREYDFKYDYSLHPRTLNSFCKDRYPENIENIQNSPLTADLNVCSSTNKNDNDNNNENNGKIGKYLYGKLTLKSLTERGCQNGRCVSLPPFKFDYNVASQTSTKYSTKEAWKEVSELNIPKVTGIPLASSSSYSSSSTSSSSSSSTSSSSSSVPFRMVFYSSGYYDNVTDVDATIIASNNTTDEWGFWNPYANEDNHKVSQSFANYGAAAWSMNKVTDPAGGVMEIKYERDVYKNGEDHSNEHLYVPIFRIGSCVDLIGELRSSNPGAFSKYDSRYDRNVCAQFLPLYWKDQCLGPRTAFWDYTKPKGYQGGDFDYMEELGLVKDDEIVKNATMYYNAHSTLKTEVKCGFWDCFSCDRYRNVGLLGSTTFEEMYEDPVVMSSLPWRYNRMQTILKDRIRTRILVLKKSDELFYAGFQLAADKINDGSAWKVLNIDGNMWAKREYAFVKGGDIRVKSLVRYDLDRIAKTEYEYEPGEMAQLPDSAYNTVMGSRFNVDLISFAMPDLDMKPKSRIVGFDDNDLLYVPGSTIMYPKVTVKNSDGDGKIINGKSEFEYITSEKGIPEEFIDPETKKSLKSFIHVNANVLIWGGDKNDGNYKVRPIVVTFEFLGDGDSRIISDNNNTPNPMNMVLYQGRTVSFNFYSNNVKNVKKIRLTYSYKDDANHHFTETIGAIEGLHMNDFNEMSITVAHIMGKWSVYKNWTRSQEKGYYPIMYKQIEYRPENLDLPKVSDAKDVVRAQEIKALFENKIIYHDFTAFLGMNKKTTIYRGNDDKAVLLKVDSSIYSTKVPDVLSGIAVDKDKHGNKIDIASKIGRQVEKWRSSRELQCINKNEDCQKSDMSLNVYKKSNDKTDESSDKKSVAKTGEIKVTDIEDDSQTYDMSYFKDEVSFEYKRYPAIQIASVTINGFDNQEKQFDASSSSGVRSSSSCDDRCKSNQKRMHWSRTENHKYDPVTSNPTATLAKIPAENGKELRKLTVTLPHHAVAFENQPGVKSATELAKRMFKKNMLAQNYAEFVYFDSKAVDESEPWSNLENVDYLKSFSIKPWNKYNGSLVYSDVDPRGTPVETPVETDKYPYVEWGSFATKQEPKDIINSNGNSSSNNLNTFVAERQYVPSAASSGLWPFNKKQFSGSQILLVDKYFKPVESKDVLNRSLTSYYSDDGLYNIGLFFPAERSSTAAIVPYGDEFAEINLTSSLKNRFKFDASKGGLVAQSSITLICSVFKCDKGLVAEYRFKKDGQKWETVRENVKEMNLTLNSDDILNYLRIYPENAEAKTFIYDRYGNIIQIVAEDNTSTFYEYNPLGQLIQSRNDDGVSFKSHHREFTNDDRNEIKWENSVMSSSSKGN